MPLTLRQRQAIRRSWTECHAAADRRRNARRIARYRFRQRVLALRRDWRNTLAIAGHTTGVCLLALALGTLCALTIVGAFLP